MGGQTTLVLHLQSGMNPCVNHTARAFENRQKQENVKIKIFNFQENIKEQKRNGPKNNQFEPWIDS
jgi:hypothetical protein